MDNKVPQQINDIVGDNVKKLAQLFPSAVKDGEVDFEALKEELGQYEEVGSEKYELTWAGKKNAKRIAQEDVIGRTLKFIPEDSKEADTTENLYIEGDNLEVLKLLRQNYYGAIKMIYIDPPYNTGNDFIYNDSFEMEQEESDIAEGVRNEVGERYIVNTKSDNRYHANWMNMIYPRLMIAKDLLTDDGAIFISIDDNEIDNVLKICNEIFGEINYVAIFPWRKRTAKSDVPYGISQDFEWILCYAKTTNFKCSIDGKERKYFTTEDFPEKPWRIIEAGTFAANGRGAQNTIIIQVTNKEIRDEIAKKNADIMGSNTDPFYGAPVILIVLGKKDWPTHVYDGSLVMGNLMLAAHDLGVGSCWIHRAKEEFESDWGKELLKSLGIEDEYEGIGHCALGYVDGDYPDVIPRKENRVFYI